MAERPSSAAATALSDTEVRGTSIAAAVCGSPHSACLSRGPALARNAISLTGASTMGHDLGHLLKADLFGRLRDFPLIAVGVEKHENPVPIELVDRFQQDLQTGLLHCGVDLVEI